MDFADKSEMYDTSGMRQMSLRCNEEVLLRFYQLCMDMKRFNKSYLLSYIMDVGMMLINYDSTKLKPENRENDNNRRKKTFKNNNESC